MSTKKIIKLVALPECPDNESIWCRSMLHGCPCVIAAIYRPPNAPLAFLKSIQDFLVANVPEKTRLIIAGDFNLPDIRWDIRQSVSADHKHCDALLDMVFSKDLTQILNESTRIGATTQSLTLYLWIAELLFLLTMDYQTTSLSKCA